MTNATKLALEKSLKHLLLKKPLDKITINDLTTDCGISRMTFYYHFKDIYDLVEWCCLEDARIALQGKKTSSPWHEQAVYLKCIPLRGAGTDRELSVPAYLRSSYGRGNRKIKRYPHHG